MTVEPPAKVGAPPSKFSQTANSLVIWFARHWLALFNTAWAVYVFTPFLAPIFMRLGWPEAAQVVYTIYSVMCHQLPTHSYFLFGADFAPPASVLIADGMSPSTNLYAQRVFIGNAEVGWKVALCERDVAIYTAVFFTGLLYGLVRDRLRPLPFKIYIFFVIPIAVDGLTQLFGWRESNWWLRTLTGALFGFASVWLAYPYVDDAMVEVVEDEMKRVAEANRTTDQVGAKP
jgi:uncharacterized membrane protein